ncbi:unnamed protein product [Arabidopsis lyrata]|uniref:uncharacterized protein At4g18490 isoform X2 n=1 Tax=Arabidopsis lyrata subsp. lyrata TaxID=81972 RepID=UPI000A29C435|nr:uncharacterized protein At4g18490 isoform X2 [Arabidopsis lyrata subsp. lyrata]CAH8276155.1 unnamed protein product [Arabidopsis lyrata]|eukprot:XP_020875481.1 uncharacterized protein At4g18490 isoform X2 [Arabidopsis lyrata subsp. lyrata]
MSAPAKRSSTDTQEKDLMLDKDMENDTWNFKSMTDDDPMDFGFDSPAKTKKNAFKLDMGFDLDGDFGSSFKMDMPDFDFSSPAKKTTKTKESSDDKPSGNSKQKKNPFAFSYDFDALDDFDLGSSPPKKGSKTTTKTMDCKEISASRKVDKSDDLDFGLDLPITRQAPSKANTDVQAKASAEKENQNSKTTDTIVVNKSTHSSQAALESMGDFEAVESPQGSRKKTSQTHTLCVQPQSVDTSPLKTSCSMVEEMDEPCPSNETVAPSPLHASEIAHTAVNRETSPDIHELCRSGTKEDCPRDPENANKKMISTMESSYEKIEQTSPSISSQLCSDKIEHQQEEMSTDTQAELQDNTKGALCDPDAGHSLTTLSGKISPGTRPSQTAKVQDLSEKLPLDPSHSMPGLNNLRAMQNKDSGLIRSRFFNKPEKPESHVLESSPIQTEIQPVTRENIGSSLNPTNDRRHDIKDALPGSKTRSCPIELVNTESAKNAANVNTSSSHEKIIHKAHSNAKTVENVAGQMDHLKLQAKNTTREKSILQINISSKLDASSLTQKLSKHLSSGAESLQKPKMISLERPKLGNITADLRAVKTQRAIGVNKDQPSSAVQPELSSSISKERNTEAPVKKSSEIHHLAPRDKTQILHCPSSLKRKALDEDADRSLKPQLKRFSMSPRENRNVEELTHRAVQGKFSSQESRIDNSTTKEPVKESPQTKSHYQNMNMANLEIPITENADNIEKAEAYTKELDNICNILKKKHEEAKELLVRAVVNNNKLLMLNHPLYEDQIRMVQKFAAKLTLRDT